MTGHNKQPFGCRIPFGDGPARGPQNNNPTRIYVHHHPHPNTRSDSDDDDTVLDHHRHGNRHDNRHDHRHDVRYSRYQYHDNNRDETPLDALHCQAVVDPRWPSTPDGHIHRASRIHYVLPARDGNEHLNNPATSTVLHSAVRDPGANSAPQNSGDYQLGLRPRVPPKNGRERRNGARGNLIPHSRDTLPSELPSERWSKPFMENLQHILGGANPFDFDSEEDEAMYRVRTGGPGML
ncbi:hypothetical protein QBC37DRAFT_403088 [Rhypophila decipiens]|uniref:Uncharacterized protein n=1 Tax=Rhypophila decipiens TaxID=261697 RepID=A0AAN6Y3R4_9PEZI|nr:hypothetical protein QBC37DRAFT_403088 [Rhypophila decipiens]